MSKLLTREGYILVKSKFDNNVIQKTKKDLTVSPYQPVQYNKKPKRFIV